MNSSDLYNQKELLLRISEGDERAFRELVLQYSGLIFSYAYQHTHRMEIAEEVVQDVFVQVWLTRTSLPEIRNLRTFLFVLARKVINHSEAGGWLFYFFLPDYVLVDSALYELYDSNDLRKTRFFMPNPNGGIDFKGNYHNDIVPFTGIATDEIYLIRAECYARAGNINLALKDLNDLLIKRWDNAVPFTPVSAANPDDALIKILEERRKELLLRSVRWSDLRRLNFDSRFAITLTRTIGGTTYTLSPQSYKYTLPIPQDIMDMAANMQQTPGW